MTPRFLISYWSPDKGLKKKTNRPFLEILQKGLESKIYNEEKWHILGLNFNVPRTYKKTKKIRIWVFRNYGTIFFLSKKPPKNTKYMRKYRIFKNIVLF